MKETGRRQAQKIDRGRKKWAWYKEILLLFFDASSMIILVKFVFSRNIYPVLNVRHMIYDHHSSCLCIPDINTMSLMFDIWSMIIILYVCVFRYKYLVHNAWHIIYDHRSSCFWLTEIKTVSLMFDRWSMIIVLYLVFHRDK